MILMGNGNNGSIDYWARSTSGGGAGGLLKTSVRVTAGWTASISIGGTTTVVINGISYNAYQGGSGGGGEGGYIAQANWWEGGGFTPVGGSSGGTIPSQTITYITPSSIGYFADDPSVFTIWLPKYTGTSSNMSSINAATGGIVPGNSSWTTYSVEWFGYFLPPSSGSYTFYTTSDDASYVWIDNAALSGYSTANALVNNGGIHSVVEKSGTIYLNGGTYYPIRSQFGQNFGGDGYTFSFAGPGIGRRYDMTGYVFNF